MYRTSLMLAGFAALMATGQEQRAINAYSPEREAAIGASLAAGVRKTVTTLDSPVLSQYVDEVGGKLAAVSPVPGTTYKFTVVQNQLGGSTNEPLALPGGAIFIPANLALESRNEAEFAGMLAHAIAHVAARHGTRLATRAQANNLAFSPVMYSNLGSPQDAAENLRDMQRSFEIEADQLTVGIMSRAGYDPELFAGYIARQQQDTEGVWTPLPPRDERIARIKMAIQQLPQNDFQRMQDELRRLGAVGK